MCDVQVLRTTRGWLFAKNSDREAAEPQPLERIAAVRGDKAAKLRATYIDVPQTANRHAVLLSRPTWMWGGEMGLNDRGVAIGNTAIFTKTATLNRALLGMDLLRLALERGDDAEHAMAVIIEHLERYGQGGPCGYRNKGFRYDNAFLIADPHQAWQLETAGCHWAARRVQGFGAISNCMSIGSDYDRISNSAADYARAQGWWRGRGEFNFAAAFETHAMPILSGARMRRRLSLQCLNAAAAADAEGSPAGAATAAVMMAHLRRHGGPGSAPHHNHDVCMHAAGKLTRPSQSTTAMVADLSADGAYVWATATSATCRSLFRPVAFDDYAWSVLDPELWLRHESIQRRMALDLLDETTFRHERDALEARLHALAPPHTPAGGAATAGALAAWDREAAAWHDAWVARARAIPWRYRTWNPAHRYWRTQNRLDGTA